MSFLARARAVARRRLPQRLLRSLRPIHAKVSARLHAGNNVYCPVCNRSFSRFIQYKDRPNAMCPGCRTLERHRKLSLFLDTTSLYTDPCRLLHIAPERHIQNMLQANPNIEYISGDLEDPTAMQRVNVMRMGFPSESFDVILCSHVLEHVEDDQLAMRELFRVLRPGGWAILDTPVDMNLLETLEDETIRTPEARAIAFGQSDHVRLYGRNYPEILRSHGFEVTVDPISVSPEDEQRFGLREADHIYHARKPPRPGSRSRAGARITPPPPERTQ